MATGTVHVKITCDASQAIRELRRARQAVEGKGWFGRFIDWVRGR